MPKMIKVVISRPSTDVAWGIPADENPGADIVASYDIVEAKTKQQDTLLRLYLIAQIPYT
jgi:hypothetical protein